MITVDELFAEDFKPEWMIHRERIRNELRRQRHSEREQRRLAAALRFQYTTGRKIEDNYRKSAAASRLRLASRCDAKGNYSNAPLPVKL